MENRNFVLAITGASGTAYAVRLAQALLRADATLHMLVSNAARQVAFREIGRDLPEHGADSAEWNDFFSNAFQHAPASNWGFPQEDVSGDVQCHALNDFSAGIASGSFLTGGMVICPCSGGTLSSVAQGISANLIHRAADVHLKERRPLLLVPREMPLGLIALENMTRLTQAGATILPAMPGFYQQPSSVADLVDFAVARICDHLKVPHNLMQRWSE